MFRANPNIQMTSMMYKNAAFVRCFRQFRKVQDVKMMLSCEPSVKFQDLRYENEAFVPGFLQFSKVEDVTTCLRRSSSNGESVSRHAKHNSTASSTKRENHVEPSVPLRAQSEAEPATPETVAHTSLLFTAPKAPFTRKNTRFRANPTIQMTSMMFKKDAFVRCFRQIPRIEDTRIEDTTS